LGPLFEELRRRNVFRVAVAYLVASWLVLQVADIVLQGIEAPAWVMQVFMLVLALVFPFVLLFSWAYELTPEGLKKEKDVDRSHSITPTTGRKLNLITIGMLVAVVAVVVIDRTFMHAHGPAPAAPSTTTAAEKSIAVLAFEDLSPGGDQAYFADGLSEELLNVLAQVPELKVAGRTSSFAFKGTNTGLREIGELLNVAHILEGSVRKSGNRIRVTAQLIKAEDGFHLFSETYDRDLEDIFAVQDEIAQKISVALLTEIVGTEATATQETDPEVYDLFLKARQRIHTRDNLNLREADAMLGRALAMDPSYAPALAQKALVVYLLSDSIGAYGDIPVSEARPAALTLVDKALALDGSLPEALAIKGFLIGDYDREAAIELLEQARKLNPTDSNVGNWLSRLYGFEGRVADARAVMEETVLRDPTYGPAFNNLVQNYVRTSEHDKAEALAARVRQIVGTNDDVQQATGIIANMRGESAAAAKSLGRVYASNPNSTSTKLWYGISLMGLADYEKLAEVGLPTQRVLAFSAQDYWEGADAILDRLDTDSLFVPRALGEIGLAMNRLGRSDALIRFVEGHFQSIETLLEEYPSNQGWDTGYLGPLAWAYRQRGDDATVATLIEAMAADLENDFRMENNWARSVSVAQHAALSGDDEAALAELQYAIENGLRAIMVFEDPIFSGLAERPEYRALRSKLIALVDQQRAAMGMAPYRPLHSIEERPTFVN
jgi:TolB-like protein/Tfp pilus assembly protein PilF